MTLTETLAALRVANIARQAEWQAGVDLPLSFRVIELGGEVGEALNLVKKLERERLGLVGSRTDANALAAELADVVICADLVALTLDIEPLSYEPPDETAPAPRTAAEATSLMLIVGLIGGDTDDAKARPHWIEDTFQEHLESVVFYVARLAQAHDIDLSAAIVAKFDATSEKVGLRTRMGGPTLGAGQGEHATVLRAASVPGDNAVHGYGEHSEVMRALGYD